MSTAFFTPVPGVNVPTTMEGVVKSQISIPVRDGSAIGAVVYQPAKLCSQGHGGPLIVAYHGGGWCMGAPASEEVNWWVPFPCSPVCAQTISLGVVIRMGLDENAVLYTDKLCFEASTPFNASAPFA